MSIWEFSMMYFDHVSSPPLTPPISTLSAFTFIPIQPGVFLFSPPSPACVTQLLLDMSPAMECGRFTRVPLIKGKWLSLAQLLSIQCKRLLISDMISCPPPSVINLYFIFLQLEYVLCTMPVLFIMWIHICNCHPRSGKHSFTEVIYHLVLKSFLLPLLRGFLSLGGRTVNFTFHIGLTTP